MENKEFAMPWQKIRLRIKYGLKYAVVELPLSLSTDPKLSMPSPRICSPGCGAFPGIGSEACRQSHHSHRSRAFSAGVVLSQQYG
jgi:hypothetical protein